MCLIHDGNIVLALGLGTMSNCWCMETGETRRLDIERRNIDVRARCHADITVEHTLWTHKPSKTSVPHCSLGTCCWGGDNWRKLHSVDMAWNGNMNTGNKVAKTQPRDTRGVWMLCLYQIDMAERQSKSFSVRDIVTCHNVRDNGNARLIH